MAQLAQVASATILQQKSLAAKLQQGLILFFKSPPFRGGLGGVIPRLITK
jgi:hypothetical protein